MTSIAVGVVLLHLPAAVGPLSLGIAGLVVPWVVGLLLALAPALWMSMHLHPRANGWLKADR